MTTGILCGRNRIMSVEHFTINSLVKGSTFRTAAGVQEYFLSINSNEGISFVEELETLYETYMLVMKQCGLSEETLVFGRFYMSDIANQKSVLRESKIYKVLRKGAVSTIQQSPVFGGDISLLVYHIKTNGSPLNREIFTYDEDDRRNGAFIQGKYYDLLWIANFCGFGEFDSYLQSWEVFHAFTSILAKHGMTLIDNAVRTWVYVRDVDNHYTGMVEARKELFEEYGLIPDTRYIASTGIEGFSKEVNSLVALDAFAIKNLRHEQIVRMEALNHLSPTIQYGVTFERGTRVRFGDRSHLHISGTASIDMYGHVLHQNDVRMQTRQTIENIRALLAPHEADLDDMAYYIAYVRSFKDSRKVMEVLETEIPSRIPLLLLQGSVCRTSWLVELEGVALIPDKTDFPPFF